MGEQAPRSALGASDSRGTTIRIATVNVNGIRAAFKRGMADWLAGRDVDILCLQEVRAPDAVVRELLGEGWHILHAEAEAKGRAGVAIASRDRPVATREHIGDDYFVTSGRWVEADFKVARTAKILTVVSAYVHSGEADTPKQVDKYRFLDVMTSACPSSAERRLRPGGRGPERRTHHPGHQELEGQHETGRLPARGARLL